MLSIVGASQRPGSSKRESKRDARHHRPGLCRLIWRETSVYTRAANVHTCLDIGGHKVRTVRCVACEMSRMKTGHLVGQMAPQDRGFLLGVETDTSAEWLPSMDS